MFAQTLDATSAKQRIGFVLFYGELFDGDVSMDYYFMPQQGKNVGSSPRLAI